MMESGVVGDLLSMKVWRAGEPEPTRPQLTWMDREPLPPSPLGLMSVVDTRVPEPMYIDTTYDDIYFTFPVPGDFNSDRDGGR